MESFKEKNGGLGSHRPNEEQLRAGFSRNNAYIAPAALGSKESLKARICDLEPILTKKRKKFVRVKAGMLKEIERVKSEFNTVGIVLKAKNETARPFNRRRKIRVYLP